MPATRSRTEHWKRSLEQVRDRRGSLEITLPNVRADGGVEPAEETELGRQILWRVQLLDIENETLVVERPGALGRAAPLAPGARLVAAMSIGQNRWMFHTRVIEKIDGSAGAPALRLAMPERVERCRRRAFYRISTAHLQLPEVRCASLSEIDSAIPAEEACRASVEGAGDSGAAARDLADGEGALSPRVGPAFEGLLLNVGGGGAGLAFDQSASAMLDPRRSYWLRINLAPALTAPLGMVARLVHTRMDSEHRIYAGVSFLFDHHPGYGEFVVDQLCRSVLHFQSMQRQERA